MQETCNTQCYNSIHLPYFCLIFLAKSDAFRNLSFLVLLSMNSTMSRVHFGLRFAILFLGATDPYCLHSLFMFCTVFKLHVIPTTCNTSNIALLLLPFLCISMMYPRACSLSMVQKLVQSTKYKVQSRYSPHTLNPEVQYRRYLYVTCTCTVRVTLRLKTHYRLLITVIKADATQRFFFLLLFHTFRCPPPKKISHARAPF